MSRPPADVLPSRVARDRQHRRRAFRRRRLVLAVIVVAAAVLVWRMLRRDEYVRLTDDGTTVLVPRYSDLSPLRARIVSIAEGQIGYVTDPKGTYCNKFSAYWQAGTNDCGNGNLDEEWCADFAAWVWQQAGVKVVYQFVSGDLNSSSASFYEWGSAHGRWHPIGSGYTPLPGDVAVYGLNSSTLVASHVAVVVGYVTDQRGPIAINGDGDQTAFSAVEVQADEYDADADEGGGAPLSGYVSPT